MINNVLYHEVVVLPQSGSEFENDNPEINYGGLCGAFYCLVAIENEERSPTGSVLPTDYTGSILFEMPRYKLGGEFENQNEFPNFDNYGCNVLEMTLMVDSISKRDLFNKNPSFFKLKTAAVSTGGLLGEFTIGPYSNNRYLNNVDWIWNVNGGGSIYTDASGNDVQWFGLIYDDISQSFKLNYWFSDVLSNVMVIKGTYEMY